MTNQPVSSIEDINAALLSQNPFAKPPYLNASDIWGKEFFDIETINAHASDTVFQALEQIRSSQYSTTSIAITAQDGTGKTHIISRIRHRLQKNGGGLFIYANKIPADSQKIKQEFQKLLAQSLGKIGSQGVTQWQELATAMTNEALNAAKSNPRLYFPQELVKKFQAGQLSELRKWVNGLTKAFFKAKDVSDPDIVKAIIWTLSNEQSLYAIKWLEGQELAQYKADELGLPSQRQSFDAVLQILDLISQYNELVICFDELDTPDAYDEISGLHISQIVASLIKDLFQNLSRGVILSVMMPAQWSNKIKQLPGGVYNKLSAQGNPLDLKYMDGESIVNLVTSWLENYYNQRSLVPPEPIYPFSKDQLHSLGKGKPTVREVLKWCKDNCKPSNGVIKPPPELDPVEDAFVKELEEDPKNYLEDNSLLADAILFSFQALIGQTVERVTIKEVTNKVTKKDDKDNYMKFKIIGKEENGNNICIGVAVLQDAGGKSLGAGLKRLNEYKIFGLTRGCLVRSKDKTLTSYLEDKYLVPLIKEKGGEYVELKEEEIRPLVAIREVHKKREVDYKLSDEQIFKFIADKGAEKMLGANNPLLKEILSDPSYEVPPELIKNEPVAVAESILADVSNSDYLDAIEALDNKIIS